MDRNKAIEVLKDFWSVYAVGTEIREAFETLIPEIKESEDERIIGRIKKAVEYNLTPKIMFKNGTWLVENEPNNYARFIQILEIVDVQGKERYRISRDLHNDEDVVECRFIENNYHSFTIQDAKDGDMIYVSTEEKGIHAIFHKYEGGIIYFHCSLCRDFMEDGYMPIGDVEFVYPLQNVHYQRFFEKMKEAGYEWDAEKKELITTKQKD